MRKFKFRLESVLNLRRKKEQQSLIHMSRAQSKYLQEVSKKNQLIEDHKKAIERREIIANPGTQSGVIATEEDFIKGTKVRITHADQSILRAKRVLDKRMLDYQFARREREVIEKLKEKAKREYLLKRKKKETKEIDEINVLRSRVKSEVSW